jgi:hypothetical protein
MKGTLGHFGQLGERRLGRSDDRPPLFRIQLAVSDKASLLNLATSLPVTPLSFSLSLA